MIRKAAFDDIELIVDTYNEHFRYEDEHGAVTVFRKGVYPTEQDAEKAVNAGTLYVYEDNGNIAGSVIVDDVQPPEYEKIAWLNPFTRNEVMVIHLLLVRPSMKGNGIATSLIRYAVELAKKDLRKAIRLDTGSQNIPALELYKKLGFQIAAVSTMKVGGVIGHSEHLFLEKIL